MRPELVQSPIPGGGVILEFKCLNFLFFAVLAYPASSIFCYMKIAENFSADFADLLAFCT
jgi:hypothetical protein